MVYFFHRLLNVLACHNLTPSFVSCDTNFISFFAVLCLTFLRTLQWLQWEVIFSCLANRLLTGLGQPQIRIVRCSDIC